MKNFLTITLSIIILLMLAVLAGGVYTFNIVPSATTKQPDTLTPTSKTSDVKNISYLVDGELFTLTNGRASKEIAPGSATKNTLTMFGEPVYGDLNNDGIQDAAIILTNNTGGSGTFYYAVLAIATGTTYASTNAILLGDRVAPQTVEIKDGRAIFNYAIRKANEPITTQPSIGKSLYIHYDTKTRQIGEWAKDFEGEADPAKMSLGMKKWIWVKTQMSDDKVISPIKTNAFTLTFGKDSRVAVTTDCNSMGGTYKTEGKTINFTQMMSTMMFCEGSQEQDFAGSLNDVGSFRFTSKGELILEIKNDSGVMVFR